MNLDRHAILLVPVLFAVLALYGGWKGRRRSGRSTTAGRVPLRRPAANVGRALLIWQLFLVGWLWFVHGDHGWTWATVGASPTVAPAMALAAGFAGYLLFQLAFDALARRLGIEGLVNDAGLVGMARILPRPRRQKTLACAGIVLLNPWTEELLFRGLLVHQLGLAVNSVAAAIAVGFLANVANHAYQGRWAQLFHIPFFALAALLLYSPLGLFGAIGFHFGGDLMPVLMLRRELAAYRRRHARQPAT